MKGYCLESCGKCGDAYAATIAAIKEELYKMMDKEVDFWLTKGPDPKGGFYTLIDSEGEGTSTDKGVIGQARYLWTLSALARSQKFEAEEQLLRQLAQRQYEFLKKFLNPETDEFFFKMDAEAKTPVDPVSMLYANSFAIYALSEYALAFDEKGAGDVALRTFKAIDGRTHDDVYLGYDQTLDGRRWFNVGAKGTNTHMHLLEAFTPLYLATNDPKVEKRLGEMIEVVRTKIFQPSPNNYAYETYYKDWSPVVVDQVNFGHDIEASWLLWRAAQAYQKVDRGALERVKPDVIRVIRQAIANAIDEDKTGAIYLYGDRNGRIKSDSRVWWPQYEGLVGISLLFELDPRFEELQMMDRLLNWIRIEQNDPRWGISYWEITKDGQVGGSCKQLQDGRCLPYLASEWKASYHSIRGLLYSLSNLED